MEYKVFLYGESVFASIFFNGGKVNPVRLTEALNRQAEEGWEVVTMERENRRTFLFFSREAFVFILKRAKLITVRDDNSLNLLNSYRINATKCNDPVWNIVLEQKENTGKIGIQLRSFPTLTNEFILELAKTINHQFSDKEIIILSLQNHLDLKPCNELKDELLKINQNLNVKVVENTSNDKVIDDISNLETLIAMRFHACLIGIKARVKVVPINYDIKIESLAKEFGLKTISLNNIESIKEGIETATTCDKEKIEEKQFDFSIIENKL